ncbi:unnamed protein product [Candida parapsilosis]
MTKVEIVRSSISGDEISATSKTLEKQYHAKTKLPVLL